MHLPGCVSAATIQHSWSADAARGMGSACACCTAAARPLQTNLTLRLVVDAATSCGISAEHPQFKKRDVAFQIAQSLHRMPARGKVDHQDAALHSYVAARLDKSRAFRSSESADAGTDRTGPYCPAAAPPPPGPVPCPLRTVPCSTVPSHVSKVAAVSVVKPGGKAVQLAVCITQIVAAQQPASDVPPDVWRTLARAALAAEGDSVAAWLRLSMVSRTWREALAGVGSPCTDCCADAQLPT